MPTNPNARGHYRCNECNTQRGTPGDAAGRIMVCGMIIDVEGVLPHSERRIKCEKCKEGASYRHATLPCGHVNRLRV